MKRQEAETLTLSTYVWRTPWDAELILGASGDELVMADWLKGWHHDTVTARLVRYLNSPVIVEKTPEEMPVIAETVAWLEAYFNGGKEKPTMKRRFFGTDFQKRIWAALERISYGETTTYGELARAVGSPGATRAAGVAVGENPFSIIVPCHRVVGKDRSLTGYGGGYAMKKALLALELDVEVDNLPFKDSRHPKGRV